MNILYLTNHLNIGGITSYVLTLAKGIKQRGHNVYLASSGGEILSRFIEEGIIYLPIPIKTKSEISPKILFSMFKLSEAVRENRIDIVHSHSRTTQVLGCLLSRKTGIKHISTCHGFFKTRLFRKIFPCWGTKIIAISQPVKEHLIHDFHLRENDIRIIHNGIDVEKFQIPNAKSQIEIRRKLGLGDGPVVGIVARLSDVKGHAYLIQAMKMVLEKIPVAQLLIVGEGREKEKLMALTQALKMEGSVFFIPQVTDTKETLSIMDLFVMSSLKEGLGLALMEAMASGLAVIASDVGGIKSLIRDGYNGLLVTPADVKQLYEAIITLLSDPQKRRYLAENAQIFIRQNFSEGKMVAQMEEVYLQCLGL